jgi:hypothetical protein
MSASFLQPQNVKIQIIAANHGAQFITVNGREIITGVSSTNGLRVGDSLVRVKLADGSEFGYMKHHISTCLESIIDEREEATVEVERPLDDSIILHAGSGNGCPVKILDVKVKAGKPGVSFRTVNNRSHITRILDSNPNNHYKWVT